MVHLCQNFGCMLGGGRGTRKPAPHAQQCAPTQLPLPLDESTSSWDNLRGRTWEHDPIVQGMLALLELDSSRIARIARHSPAMATKCVSFLSYLKNAHAVTNFRLVDSLSSIY